MRDNQEFPNWLLIILALVAASFLIYSLVVLSLVVGSGDPGVNLGTFGDAFGFFNAFFAGSAFVGVLWTLHIQRLELRDHRAEFRKMAETQAETLLIEQNLARISLEVQQTVMLDFLPNATRYEIKLCLSVASKACVDVHITCNDSQVTALRYQKIPIWNPGEVHSIEGELPNYETHRKRGEMRRVLVVRIFYESAAGQRRVLRLKYLGQSNHLLLAAADDLTFGEDMDLFAGLVKAKVP